MINRTEEKATEWNDEMEASIIKHLVDRSISVFREKFSEKHLTWNEYQKKHKKDSAFNYRGVKFLKERPFLKSPFILLPNKIVCGMDTIAEDRFCGLFDYNDIPKPIKVLVDANISLISSAQMREVTHANYAKIYL